MDDLEAQKQSTQKDVVDLTTSVEESMNNMNAHVKEKWTLQRPAVHGR